MKVRIQRRWRAACIAGLLCLSLSLLAAPTAHANGGPVRIVLSYVQGISNWGPHEASGVLELVKAEGEVRMTATGLPSLSDEQYVLWIVQEATGEHLKLASFNANAEGVAQLDLLLPQPIPDSDWSLALVTVESSPEASQPGQRRSLAGHFPKPVGARVPSQLPNTGGGVIWLDVAGALAASVVLAAVALRARASRSEWR
uniref:Anti-sigma factor n=1 Tax=Thermorudis sp. TaxID=1969470 RepID=A0A7C2WHM0_9BACT